MAYSIAVEKLSKQYRIGELHGRTTTFSEAVINLVKHPFWREKGKKETIWALRDVSFDVIPGEVLGVIGGNGAASPPCSRSWDALRSRRAGVSSCVAVSEACSRWARGSIRSCRAE